MWTARRGEPRTDVSRFPSQSQQAGRIGNAAWSESDFNDEITSFGPERTAMSQLSKRVVTEAGKIIRGRPSLCDETIEAFKTAHAWREAHAIPMRKVRLELGLRARRIDIGSIVAGRLKRMQSIRRKMERHTVTLHQMQDIAGCRAIVGSVAEVDQLMEIYRAGASRHKVRRIYDYASSPKPSGYRSQHLVMEFQGKDEDAAFDGRLIELQVRTTLQHAWATAVEAVGLVRAEELKSSRGSNDWLRLFTLMGSELALEEGSSIADNVPGQADLRLQELVEIADRLDAVRTLEGLNRALLQTESMPSERGQSYLIQFDNARQTVDVRRFSASNNVAKAYFAAEQKGPDVVMVEVERVEDLRAAYPNYFLDVRLFTGRLKRLVLHGETAAQLPPRARSKYNLDWLKDAEFLFGRRR